MELAQEVARLADAIERETASQERREREERAKSPGAGRQEGLRAFGLSGFLAAIPGLAGKFDRIVPSDFVAQTSSDEVTVACPCGSDPQVRAGGLASCECGRWFLHDGRDVHVALTPREGSETSA